jgi:hypothetical protein
LDEHQRPDPAGVVEDYATAEKGWRFCFLDLSSRILGGSQGIPLRPQGPQTRSEALFKHVLATSCIKVENFVNFGVDKVGKVVRIIE